MASTRSQQGKLRRVIVVGCGLAGLTTTVKLCESGVPVLLLSSVPFPQCGSVSVRDGVAAALPGESAQARRLEHFEHTVEIGDFLAHQAPVKAMVDSAPRLVELLARMGVPLDRTAEGWLLARRCEGAGSTTAVGSSAGMGQQLTFALHRQVRRFEAEDVTDEQGHRVVGERMVQQLSWHAFLRLVLDDNGVAVGAVVQDLRNMRVRALPADAVCLATGGAGRLFSRTTAPVAHTGSAAAALYRQGAILANPEFLQFHPLATVETDEPMALPDGLRGSGGRLWVPRDPSDRRAPAEVPEQERDYFLERYFPELGHGVGADVASRAIYRVLEDGLGKADDPARPGVYFDAAPSEAQSAWAQDYRRLSGRDPEQPILVFPAVSETLGGLWVDYERRADGAMVRGSPRNHATSLSGAYAVGEAQYLYHGAGLLSGNALLSRVFSGLNAAEAIVSYRAALARSPYDLPGSVFEKRESAEQQRLDDVFERAHEGSDEVGPFELQAQLADAMSHACGPERDNDELHDLLEELDEFEERAAQVRISDTTDRFNQSAQHALDIENMVLLARAVATAAHARQECRGAHHKPALARSPGRDDEQWLRTTLLRCDASGRATPVRQFDYDCAGQSVQVTDEVDASLLLPGPRRDVRG